jgi:predicted nucleotidyltransferase/DNA-binding XRE family transcriptional regulator
MNTLKQLRKQSQLTQIEAAKICGVSRRTFQTYEEKGNINCTYDDLVKLLNEIKDHPLILPLRYIKEKACDVLSRYPQVQCAYLFGSYARGEATETSDVDILVVLNDHMGLEFFTIKSELEEKLSKKVDLVSLDEVSNNEEFIARILKEGVKIYGHRVEKAKT